MDFNSFNLFYQRATNLIKEDLVHLKNVVLPEAAKVLPTVAKKTQEIVQQVKSNVSSWNQQAQEAIAPYITPESLQKAADLTGNAVSLAKTYAATQVMLVTEQVKVIDELFDFANFGGTKDPSASIEKSYQRIALQNKDFADCCDFLSDQISQLYLTQADDLKTKVQEAIQNYDFAGEVNRDEQEDGEAFDPFFNLKATFFSYAASGAEWFLNSSKELIVQTIKANVLHILANLSDEGFGPDVRFADRERNPFGRLLKVVASCLMNYKERLSEIDQLPKDQQAECYHEEFKKISTDLLERCFPNGADDIQLFHHTIPVKLIKGRLWDMINKELPVWLEKFYFESRPLNLEHPDWEKEFEQEGYGLEAGHLKELPSRIIHHFIREERGELVNGLEPALNKWMCNQGFKLEDAEKGSQILVKYIKEFLLTNDPTLINVGSFFERYFMERILNNLAQFVPDAVKTPLPLYILQQWTECGPFKMFIDALSGNMQEPKVLQEAIPALLSPFGLDQEETFPLPPSLKELVWPSILQFQNTMLPDLIVQLIPEWSVLSKVLNNHRKLKTAMDDEALIHNARPIVKQLIDQGIEKLVDSEFSLAQQLNEFLPYPLTKEQEGKIDEQWKALLKDNDTLKLWKSVGATHLEALLIQICADLFDNYKADCGQEGMQNLFENVVGEENGQVSGFFEWLMQEAIKSFESLSIERLSEQELDQLREGIRLKNVIQSAKDPSLVQDEIADLENLWPTLKPQFERLTQHLLSIPGYDFQRRLPVPKELQPIVWKTLTAALPKILFEQASDFILPFLEREELEEQVKLLPEGDRIVEGCQLAAKDFVDNFPDWIDEKIDDVPNLLIGLFPALDLTKKANDYIVDNIREFTQQGNTAFDPIWQWVEKYVEGLLLKVAAGLGQMSAADLREFQALVKTTREKLLKQENAVLLPKADDVKDPKDDPAADKPLADDVILDPAKDDAVIDPDLDAKDDQEILV